MNRQTPARLSIENTRHRCSAGTGTRRKSHADPTFPKRNLDLAIVQNVNELDVGAIWKRRMTFQQWPDCLNEVVVRCFDEERTMRIPRRACRDRDTTPINGHWIIHYAFQRLCRYER